MINLKKISALAAPVSLMYAPHVFASSKENIRPTDPPKAPPVKPQPQEKVELPPA